ncbi:MAG TPA: hypothetical protein VMU84_19270 [Thermoanaerobaculia bacterium]|nr:hypothetical protein [Thermoanaerobaculia bacterium]
MSDEPKSTEEQNEKIHAIVGSEALGSTHAGREEHSGQNAPEPEKGLRDQLADNKPSDL